MVFHIGGCGGEALTLKRSLHGTMISTITPFLHSSKTTRKEIENVSNNEKLQQLEAGNRTHLFYKAGG